MANYQSKQGFRGLPSVDHLPLEIDEQWMK